MSMIDSSGHRVSGDNAQSLALFEKAALELLCMVDDPVATVDSAIAASPPMTMAHVLKAWLNLLGTEPSGVAGAQACLDAADKLGSLKKCPIFVESSSLKTGIAEKVIAK